MPSTERALVQVLAEQSFMLHVLNKRLVELGILQCDELPHLFEFPSKEKENYIEDFTHQMAARGLHLD
jgi:hypothetical protein